MAASAFSIPKSLLGRIPRRQNLTTLPNASAAVIGMTSLMLLVQVSGVASMAYEVQRLEDLRNYWQETNYRVEADIAGLQSLSRVENDAINGLKMVMPKEVIPVTVARPAPSRPAVAEAVRTEIARPAPASSGPWYQEFADFVSQTWARR